MIGNCAATLVIFKLTSRTFVTASFFHGVVLLRQLHSCFSPPPVRPLKNVCSRLTITQVSVFFPCFFLHQLDLSSNGHFESMKPDCLKVAERLQRRPAEEGVICSSPGPSAGTFDHGRANRWTGSGSQRKVRFEGSRLVFCVELRTCLHVAHINVPPFSLCFDQIAKIDVFRECDTFSFDSKTWWYNGEFKTNVHLSLKITSWF